MANTLSARKAMRVNEKHKKFNDLSKNKLRTARKLALKADSKTDVKKKLAAAYAAFDAAAKKRVIHKNTAGRYKSRLAKAVNKSSKA